MARITEREFGNSRLTSSKLLDLEHFYGLVRKKDWYTLAMYFAYAEGCPEFFRIMQERGPWKAASEYGELLFLRGYMAGVIKPVSKKWYADLTETRRRKKGEQPGRCESGWVPIDHDKYVSGPARPNGYNLPRLMREYLGPREKRSASRIDSGFLIFDYTIQDSLQKGHTTTELVVSLAERFAVVDRDPLKYVRRLLSLGKLEEDNQCTEYGETITAMRTLNTSLWDAYQQASSEELCARGIADFKHYV